MVESREISEKNTWEGFLDDHTEANFLQSWLWGDFQASLSRKIFRVGFFENQKLLGLMFAYIETSKRGKFLVVPGGPIVDWKDKDLLKKFAEELRKIASDNSCVFVRCRPQLVDDNFSQVTFNKLGFKPAPMYLHAELTRQLDITKSEEELLANMRKATRYEVKKAEKLEIKIEKNGEKNIEKFYDLQIETANRQKFVPFSKKFLLNQFDIFIKDEKAILYTAKFEGKILAQAFIIFYGQEAVYHYGASTEDGRRYPGAYLLQWEAICEAKKRGMSRYNFWGVSPEGSKDHRFAGLSLFKRGFGGQDVAYLPAQDLVVEGKRYLVDYWFEKLRRKIRKV
ncbi:MAG TPA: peptidoglycan bridge formation glycyltransferase FemA/FemB family protein [Patescibacteria group bacterium]|nr:peptidoglycan bridge formation glycyltransferase FemA/FemB family protein [Patescibacteria group bacterium]